MMRTEPDRNPGQPGPARSPTRTQDKPTETILLSRAGNGAPLPRGAASNEALRLQNLGSLAGSFSHKLNNLLNHIIGYSTLTMSDKDIPRELAQNLEGIEQSTREAVELSGRFSALTGNGEEGRKEPVDLARLLLEAVHLLGRFPGRRTRLSYHIEPGLPPVYADPDVLEQVLLSLLLAAKRCDGVKSLVFATADRIEGTRPSETKVRVHVSRTPVHGNSQAPPARSQADPMATHPSLPIAESIIRSLGGTMSLSATADHSMELEVLLPAVSPVQPSEGNESTWKNPDTIRRLS